MRKRVFLVLTAFALAFAARAQYGPVGFVNYNDGCNGITGGSAGQVVRVTTRQQLADYAGKSAPYVIIVDGKLEGNRRLLHAKQDALPH